MRPTPDREPALSESALDKTALGKTVLGKTMSVLQAFAVERTTLSFAELQDATGLAKSTTHRLLGSMVGLGLLERDAAGRYRLSRLVFELGMRASVERGLLEVSMPFMQDLRDRTRETVHLGVREGAEVVYVAKVHDSRQAAAPSRLGGRMPLHATAIGKVLLAHAPAGVREETLGGRLTRLTARTVVAPGLLARQLDQVLERGVAFEREESADGVVCVAAPIADHDGEALAAISVTGPTTRFRPEAHVAAVQAAAHGIAATLARRAQLLD